jgi:hypothetical protein
VEAADAVIAIVPDVIKDNQRPVRPPAKQRMIEE